MQPKPLVVPVPVCSRPRRPLGSIAPIVAAVSLALPASGLAAEYRCNGDRVERGGSTQYTVRTSGQDYTIEKGGSTRGRAVKRGSKHAVEVGGSTQATIENGRIEKGGASWSTVANAQRTYNCPDVIAATLWVLAQNGKL